MDKKCCGTCEYGKYDEMQGYVCVNADSDYVADFVDCNYICGEYKDKEQNMAKQCITCEHFKKISQPKGHFECGQAICKEHNLIVDYFTDRTLKRLTCVEDEKKCNKM